MTSERRRHPRLSINVEIDFASGSNFYSGKTRDVSLGGVFIETNFALEIGTKIQLDLKFLDRRAKVDAEVAWQLVEHGHVVGVGVHYLHVSAAAEKSIAAFMALRKPIAFDSASEPPPGPDAD
jgi:Tfp pilus assembly protein PilZ